MVGDASIFRLRPVLPGDAARIAELIGDWEVVRWLSTPPHPYSQADAEQFVARDEALPPFCTLAIEIDGALGGIAAVDQRARGANLGYWLGRPYWGRGIMTRAAGRLTRDFFANSQESRLNSGYFSGNVASMSIQRRLGFETTGEGLLFSRSQGKRLPHIETTLTRAKFEAMQDAANAQRHLP